MPLRSCRNGYNYVAATIDDFLFEAATDFFLLFQRGDGAPNGIAPTGNGIGGIGGRHGVREASVGFPLMRYFICIFPESHSQAGEVSRAASGGFGNGGSHYARLEHIALELHKQIVARSAAVNFEFGDSEPRVLGHGFGNVESLKSNTFEGSASNVSCSGAATDARDGAASILVPPGSAETGESRHEVHAVGVGHFGSQSFHIG